MFPKRHPDALLAKTMILPIEHILLNECLILKVFLIHFSSTIQEEVEKYTRFFCQVEKKLIKDHGSSGEKSEGVLLCQAIGVLITKYFS